jgi:uncharacterized protein with HEPN domain
MNERDPLFLRDILRAVSAIERYTEAGKEAFSANELIQDAVVRRLEIMGEAARNVSIGLRDAEKAVPWKLMIGTRDNLTHGYFKVDLDVVWAIVEHDLAPLKREIARILGQS